MSRPTKLTVELIERIAKRIRLGNFRGVAFKAEGVSERTGRHWLRQGKTFPDGLYGQFRRAVLGAEQQAEADAVVRIYEAGSQDVAHLKWWLERKHTERWCRRWKLFEREVRERLKAIEDRAGGAGMEGGYGQGEAGG